MGVGQEPEGDTPNCKDSLTPSQRFQWHRDQLLPTQGPGPEPPLLLIPSLGLPLIQAWLLRPWAPRILSSHIKGWALGWVPDMQGYLTGAPLQPPEVGAHAPNTYMGKLRSVNVPEAT